MGFSFYRSLTIDHTRCGSSDSLSFPVLVSASDATLKDAAHGGHVRSSTGADILFFSSSAATTQYHSEIDFYDNVNGVLRAWVQVPTVSHTADTTFYLLYGNVAPPPRTTNPWDANYMGVWHLPNGTTLSVADSTGQANGTNGGATATSGQIDGAAVFNSAASVDLGLPASLYSLTTKGTLSCWLKLSANSALQAVFAVDDPLAQANGYGLFVQSVGSYTASLGASGLVVQGGSPTLGVWVYISCSFDGATLTLYVNGSSVATASQTGSINFSGTSAQVGVDPGGDFLSGTLDELRVSNIARSAAWTLTEYNNQQTPGNIGTPAFLTWSAETPISGPTVIVEDHIRIGTIGSRINTLDIHAGGIFQ